ncbi:MAG: bifunctional folylpolyglutamate synthase/dihydrofolate synthase [Bacteroidetes bacterium]|nr:bifunctional folylpolyglutamate synthase/dihydrofolate synthase [Bacteroidota bacterium]PIX33354.1 MAG: dihydrofolate synthase [Bacteroidetes bacterium CG_4_8_14_3_um_filter_31_14]
MFHRVGKSAYKANLNNTITLDNYFKNPHKKFKTIHVAGTNGKGSVSHLIASILQDAGYKTGLFTSPHLKDFRERIKVNGLMITEEEVAEFIDNNIQIIKEVNPSFFELATIMAFEYFKNSKVDVAVIETGLGGRLDCTNIIKPVLSIITNVSWDHNEILGNTLEKIAIEKAGIIKKHTPVILGEFQKNISHVFNNKANELKSELIWADKTFSVKKSIQTPDTMQMFRIKYNKEQVLNGLKTPLLGEYQKKNTATVLASVEKLKNIGFIINDKNIYKGFKNVINNTTLKGRWQILSNNPLVICDIGHNVGGIKQNVTQLNKLKYETLHIVFGMVADKDFKKILKLLPKNAIYYFTKANIPRAKNEIELQKIASEYGLTGKTFSTVKKAYNSALKSAKQSDIVFVGGSAFVVAEVL